MRIFRLAQKSIYFSEICQMHDALNLFYVNSNDKGSCLLIEKLNSFEIE